MRPIKRGLSPIAGDFKKYSDAANDLHTRIGAYCSYCERKIEFLLAVEHIQAKGIPKYAHLECRWNNFLFGCVNCNSTKKDKDVALADVLLPDRDNTFYAYVYHQDGTITVSTLISPAAQICAANTLALVGLDKSEKIQRDTNLTAVARGRVAQRKSAWDVAQESADDLRNTPSDTLRSVIIKLALATGFFSVWMKVFEHDIDMRVRLIRAFNGSEESECFHAITTAPVFPAPNPDALPHGGKA
ncbi:HNH endonuclease [Pseudomonas syringae]|uniref:HNH endonuclease n=1 Tax=Pseudomonas syringae TaxID=317 RepID=UPI0010126F05|nr:HNH endonuclease [Pseudomonas syringae]RXT62603.1 hypothetical protein B1F71_23805 [Pseudomonas syringae]RXT98125.1 hypothetical protein B1F75_01620 [Pseudomonas syringae]